MIKNYHEQSMKWEDKYTEKLLEYYGILLIDLNNIKKLTKTNINVVIADWEKIYGQPIRELTRKYLYKLNDYADKLVPTEQTSKQEQKEVDKLIVTNDKMLDITTEYVRQKFTELGVLESSYNYSQDLIDKFLQTVVNQVEDKLTLFAVMSTINNLRTLMFSNATSGGWTQYQWRTQRDAKVRPSHAAMDNKWCDIDDPEPQPVGCRVGEDYNCRCWAIRYRKPGALGIWIYSDFQ